MSILSQEVLLTIQPSHAI
nr:unnamed protein product [Callosobruchus chinensis]